MQREKPRRETLPPRAASSSTTLEPWAAEAEAALYDDDDINFRFPRGDVAELGGDDGSLVIEAYLGEKIEVRLIQHTCVVSV